MVRSQLVVEMSTPSSRVRTGSIELTMLPSSGPTNAPTEIPTKALQAAIRRALGCAVADAAAPARPLSAIIAAARAARPGAPTEKTSPPYSIVLPHHRSKVPPPKAGRRVGAIIAAIGARRIKIGVEDDCQCADRRRGRRGRLLRLPGRRSLWPGDRAGRCPLLLRGRESAYPPPRS